jgi:hypothetical protein
LEKIINIKKSQILTLTKIFQGNSLKNFRYLREIITYLFKYIKIFTFNLF